MARGSARACAWLLIATAMWLSLSPSAHARSESATSTEIKSYVEKACNETEYPRACRSTMLGMGYASEMKAATAAELTKAAVKASLSNVGVVCKWAKIQYSNKSLGISKKDKDALQDCIENLEYARDWKQKTLKSLKHLNVDKPKLKLQMSDLQTWMSAALTDEDYCIDGFDGESSEFKSKIVGLIQSTCQITTNALVFVNKLAASNNGY